MRLVEVAGGTVVAAAVAAVAAGADGRQGRSNMSPGITRAALIALWSISLVTATPMLAIAQEAGTHLDEYAAAEPPAAFPDAQAAADALKAALGANDFEATARLLGLDPAKVKDFEGIQDSFTDIRNGAAERLQLQQEGERSIVLLGRDLWPLPFPLTKTDDGKWAFDTFAGFEEIINRRIGENELEAIATSQAYVDAQVDYAAEDRDGDGVLEYSQRLVSSEGQTDGLYWPLEQGDGDSPAGGFIDQAAFDKAKAGEGYYGYRFRILRGQGNNIAGGRYDYVINGNMIAGFALIAWPVEYAETGVSTFVVNQAGVVYEKDLGPDTQKIVMDTFRFNPDKTWEIAR
jgi:hypothetical protein